MLLKMKEIDKVFPGVKALDQVNFELQAGEVHALMGENGAGKSTLMKILTGVYQRDGGDVHLNTKEVNYENTREAQDDGVVIVHQELNNAEELTVSENIFLGREETKGFLINDRVSDFKSKELFDNLGVSINPQSKLKDLTVGEAQMVEIAKAISMNSRIIVFDEPTAALSQAEIEHLFRIIGDLKEQGVGIVYISHRMEEIGIISDRITVLRDGEYVGTVETEKTSKDHIIKMMVGRQLSEDPKEISNVSEDAPIVLEVKNLVAGDLVKNISFNLRKGEILGISGLMGAGRTETARAIFGADPIEEGELYLNGKKIEIKSTTDAVNSGIGYVSEDRRKYGVLVEKNISENISLNNLEPYINKGLIQDQKIIEMAENYRKMMRIKSSSVDQEVKNLSGGNQQKVVISKWLARDSDIIIFDEPTRGIDIGAKAEIYDLMDELVKQGKSIIMISSEMNEILRMSDRIIVLCEGRLTGELPIEEATQEKILEYATMRSEI